jgi:hypothetical protein
VSFDKIGHGEIKKASALSIAATVDKRPPKSWRARIASTVLGHLFREVAQKCISLN